MIFLNSFIVRYIKRYLKLSALYFIADAINRAIYLVLLPVLTRWLSPGDYGLIGTFNALRNNIEPAIKLSASGAVIRAYYDKDDNDFDFQAYIFNAIIVNLVLSFFITIILYLCSPVIKFYLHFPPKWLWAILIVSIASAFSSLKIKLWLYQNKPVRYGAINIILAILNIILTFFLLFFVWMDWKGRIAGIVVAEVIVAVISFLYLLKEDGINPKIDYSYIKDILIFGLPLYPHSLGLMAIGVADKFLINSFVGLDELGIYNVAYVLSSIILMVGTALELAVAPTIYKMLKNPSSKDISSYIYFTYGYIFLLIILAFGLSVLADPILQIVVGKKFYGASKFILYLGLAQVAFAGYRLLGKTISFYKKNYFTTITTFTSGTIAILANYYLIRSYGAMGAAWGTMLARLCSFCMIWYFAQRLHPMPWFRAVFRGMILLKRNYNNTEGR